MSSHLNEQSTHTPTTGEPSARSNIVDELLGIGAVEPQPPHQDGLPPHRAADEDGDPDQIDFPAPAVLQAMANRGSAAAVVQALGGMTANIADAALDARSTYRDKFTTKELKVSNWASAQMTESDWGAAPAEGGKREFTNGEVKKFFADLFKTAAAEMHADFSRSDLFHCHLNYYNDDVVLIFHAKEYPDPLEAGKANAAESLEPGSKFGMVHEHFKSRNAVYSMKSGKLTTIKDMTDADGTLAKIDPSFDDNDIFDGLTLQDGKFGHPIASVNFFPAEGIEPFLS
jgi:hypothetical protein